MTDLNEIDILTRNPSVIGSDDENKDGGNKDSEDKTMEEVSCESTTKARENLDLVPGKNISSVRQDACLLSVQKETDRRECGAKVHDHVEFGFEDETHASGGKTTVTTAAAITTRKSTKVASAATTAETNPKFTCRKCDLGFKTGTEIRTHIADCHRENNYGECYDCGLKVNGLKELMKHKKEHHPKNIECKNISSGNCQFGKNCWYIHSKKPEFECHMCNNAFSTINDLKKHGKRTHPNHVNLCKKFVDGTCTRNSESCWYTHEAASDIQM